MYYLDVIGDRRVEGLYQHLHPLCPGLRTVQTVEYGRLEDISAGIKFMIDPATTDHPPNAVVVMGGLYEVLNIKTTPIMSVTLRHMHSEYAPKLINGMYEALVESAFIINPRVKIINCTVYGASMNTMLDPASVLAHPHQGIANSFIQQINRNILDLNARFGVHTPYTDRITHRYHPGRGDFQVYKDLQQGYLPTTDALKKCAQLIASSLNKDSANW